MVTIRWQLAALLLLVAGCLLVGAPAADAQEQQFRFIFTPQVWLANIPKNGFAAAGGGGSGFPVPGFVTPFVGFDDFDRSSTDPTSVLFPQWGGQLALQYGRWTFGVAAQYISFEHSTEWRFGLDQKINFKPFGADPPRFPQISLPCTDPILVRFGFNCGIKFANEIIRTDRIDIDLTASYFFPDVLPKLMDVNAGLGFKWVRASGHRTLDNANACDTVAANCTPPQYVIKGHDLRTTPFLGIEQFPTLRNKASFLDNVYAVTFPTTFNFHLTSSGKWLLPFTVVPLVGAQERTDEIFGYSTSFAWGGSLDAGVRYVMDSGIAVYAGMRGQAIYGINTQVAWGPLFNMSIPFGGK